MANFGWGEGAWGEGPWGGLVELSLTINGVEVISNVISSEGSLQIEQNTLLIPILQFQIYNRLSETVAIAAPIPPQEVSLTVRGVLEFGGVISSVLPKRLSETVILYEVTAVGFHRTLDYVTTNRDSFASIKSGVVIKNLLAKYTPWLASDLSAIQDGPVLSQLDVRNRKLSELFSELALSAGFIFYVNNLKKPFFQPLSENKASLIIDDAATTYMFDSLDVSPDFSRITNVVRVLGGLQKGSSVTEVFPGTSGLSNFPLKYPVHGADRAAVLFDEFSGTSFNANWVQVDISNPTPPPNHIATDGYIFPEFELLQIVGGPGSYGFVALLGLETQQRKHFREFSCEEVFIVALGEGVVCALTDGVGHAFSDILSGVVFKANGELRIVENGVESGALTSYVDVLTGNTINTAPTFEVGKTYTVMIQTYKVAAEVVPRGVRYLIQGGTTPNFGAVGTRSWAQLKDTQFASDPQEFVGFAPIIDHSAQMTIRQVRIKDTVDVVLTVGGVSKNVGTLTDTSAKNDAVIDANAVPNLLVFFTDSIPATTVEITYFKKEQTVIVRRNAASIERIKGLSPLIGDTGERHSTIEPSFKPESVSDVVRIASNYLAEFSSEKITGRVLTYTPLLTNDTDPPRAGQIMTVNLTSQGIGPLDVVISRVTSSLVSGKYTNSSSQNSVIVRYDIEFSDVDSYEKFLLQNQQDLRVRDLEGVTSQDIQVIDVGSLITLSDVLSSQTFPEANPIVGEGIVGLTDLDGTNFQIFVSALFNDVGDQAQILENTLTDEGDPWVRHPTSETTLVISGNAVAQAGSAIPDQSVLLYANKTLPSAEYTVKALVGTQPTDTFSSPGIIGRCDATAATYYEVTYDRVTSLWQLNKVVATTKTLLGSFSGDDPRLGVRAVQLVLSNALKSVIIDGVTRITSVDNAITTVGFAGFATVREGTTAGGAVNWMYDDFQVTTV